MYSSQCEVQQIEEKWSLSGKKPVHVHVVLQEVIMVCTNITFVLASIVAPLQKIDIEEKKGEMKAAVLRENDEQATRLQILLSLTGTREACLKNLSFCHGNPRINS